MYNAVIHLLYCTVLLSKCTWIFVLLYPTIHRGIEWPLFFSVLYLSVFMQIVIFLFILQHDIRPPWLAQYNIYKIISSKFLCLGVLARSPDDPQRIRVASVFEFSVTWLCVCLQILSFLSSSSSFSFIYPTVSSVINF